MPKSKYKFDAERLSYEKIVLSKKQFTFKALRQIGALTVIAVIILVVMSLIFDTPGEKLQKRENQQLVRQYEMLNDKLARMENVMGQIEERDDDIYRLIFGVEPISDEQRKAGMGGVNRYHELEKLNDGELVIQTSQRLDMLMNKMYVQFNSYNEVVELAAEKESFLASIPAISPISDKELTRFASGYGYRIHPIYRTRKMHEGIDLTAPTGTLVHATGNGKIIKASYTPGGYGKRVIVDHGFGYKTMYAHLSEIDVKVGQKVKRGELLGKVGSTGRSTAPHLHYEVRKNNQTENPVNYYYNDLTPEQYDEMILVSSRENMSFD